MLDLSTKLTNQYSCPEVRNFCVQVAEASLKSNWLVVLGSRICNSFAELKGHEHVAKAVTVGINTCFCISVSRAFGVA